MAGWGSRGAAPSAQPRPAQSGVSCLISVGTGSSGPEALPGEAVCRCSSFTHTAMTTEGGKAGGGAESQRACHTREGQGPGSGRGSWLPAEGRAPSPSCSPPGAHRQGPGPRHTPARQAVSQTLAPTHLPPTLPSTRAGAEGLSSHQRRGQVLGKPLWFKGCLVPGSPFTHDSTLLCPGGEGEGPPLSTEQAGPAWTHSHGSYSRRERAPTRSPPPSAGRRPAAASWTPA